LRTMRGGTPWTESSWDPAGNARRGRYVVCGGAQAERCVDVSDPGIDRRLSRGKLLAWRARSGKNGIGEPPACDEAGVSEPAGRRQFRDMTKSGTDPFKVRNPFT